MIFQLDENICSGKLRKYCEGEACSKIIPFPPEWRKRGKNARKDPMILSQFMGAGTMLVTRDVRIANDSTSAIPIPFPGILIVNNYPSQNTITWKDDIKVIGQFKKLFAIWRDVEYRNSVVIITYSYIEVSHIEMGQVKFDDRIEFVEQNWQGRLTAILKANSARQKSIAENLPAKEEEKNS